MEKKKDLTVYEKNSRDRIIYLIDTYCNGNQQRFVERTGINKGAVSQYVNGKNSPSNITADKIGNAFGVNPVWVMGFDVPMKFKEVITQSDLSDIEMEIITRFRQADEFDQETVLRTLRIKRADYISSAVDVG